MASTQSPTAAVQSAPPSNTVLNVLDRFSKLLFTTAGRDKLNKFLQYGSKIAVHQLESSASENKMWIDKITKFETGVAAGRKVARFYRFLPGYVAVVRFIQKYMRKKSPMVMNLDLVLEFLDLLQKVAVANYFLLDSCSWGAKLGILSTTKLSALQDNNSNSLERTVKSIFNNERFATFGHQSNWQWFISLVLLLMITSISFTRGFEKETTLLLELNDLEKKRAEDTFKNVEPKEDNDPEKQEKRMLEIRQDLKKVYSERYAHMRSFAANACDLGIAVSLLGMVNLSKGTMGLLGCVSALISTYDVW